MTSPTRIPPILSAAALALALVLAGCGGYTDPDGDGGGGEPPSGSFTLTGPSDAIEVPRGGETTFDVTVTFDDGYDEFVRLESGSWEAGLSVWHSEPGFPVSLREVPISEIASTATFTLTLRADASADASSDQNNFGIVVAQGTDDRGRTRLKPSSQIKPRVVVR